MIVDDRWMMTMNDGGWLYGDDDEWLNEWMNDDDDDDEWRRWWWWRWAMMNDEDDEITDIFSYIGDENILSKIEVFDKLAQYTLKYYSSEMGELKTVFPNVVNTITDWRRPELVPERESNIGKEVETCIINYSNKVKNIEASDVANKGRGQDAIIGGKTVEIKSSKDNKPLWTI